MKSFLIFTVILFQTLTLAQSKTVYMASIEGDIDLGLAPFIQRVVTEANEEGADAIIFVINTFGGRVDAATQIKDAILNSSIPTIAFVNKRAISAGALITLSCKNIAMAPGSSIGASTVVDQSGKKQSEKYQSYMRSEMRATAERNGRPTTIAEGMVDERVMIPGLVDSTQLVTLTAEESVDYKIADTITTSVEETLAYFGYENAEIIKIDTNWAEDFVRFLGNPIISSLLIMIGMIGLFTEVKTAGWGVPGTLGLLALGLFFGSSFILNLASVIDIVLFVLGFILIIVEVFVIPGFGIAGIGGIILMLAALFMALINTDVYVDYAMIQAAIIRLAITLAASVVVIVLLYKYLPKTRTFRTFVLADATSGTEGFFSSPDFSDLLGKEGKTVTPLRPSGIALIDGKRYDVVTEGGFTDKDTLIKVIEIDGVKIVVNKID